MTKTFPHGCTGNVSPYNEVRGQDGNRSCYRERLEGGGAFFCISEVVLTQLESVFLRFRAVVVFIFDCVSVVVCRLVWSQDQVVHQYAP